MTEREHRDAIAAELAMHYRNDGLTSVPIGCSCGEEFDGFTTWRRHIADAVLAVLDQQGWPDAGPARAEVRNLERQIVVMGVALDQAEAERDAALREAARYEQVGFATVPRDLHTHSAQHQERWIDHGCVPLYRQVTEGEEG